MRGRRYMDVSRVLNPGDISDESKWLAGFINWSEDFFLDQMSLTDYERTKFKEELSYIRRDIKNGHLLGFVGPFINDAHWLVHKKLYKQRYTIRNIFYLNPQKKCKCLFLEIEEYDSSFKDFFLSLHSLKRTGQMCPICGCSTCTVQVEEVTYPDIPKKAFLTAQCNNSQCRDVGKKMNEQDYLEELKKMCAKEM
jgi:hypothetical protein